MIFDILPSVGLILHSLRSPYDSMLLLIEICQHQEHSFSILRASSFMVSPFIVTPISIVWFIQMLIELLIFSNNALSIVFMFFVVATLLVLVRNRILYVVLVYCLSTVSSLMLLLMFDGFVIFCVSSTFLSFIFAYI